MKYQYWLKEEGLKEIDKWARAGLTNEQISKNMGITSRCLRKWINKFPRVEQILKTARKPKEIYTKPKPHVPQKGRRDTPEFRLEREFKTRVESLGGIAYKLTIREHNGIPDRMITFPGGHIAFVEVKRPDGKGYLRPTQKREISLLQEQGQAVYVLDSYEQIDPLIETIKGL